MPTLALPIHRQRFKCTEKAPQYLRGPFFDFTAIGGVTDLKFVDWPARIGIDNLVVNDCCRASPADLPEPGSLALVGVALAGLGPGGP